MSAFSPVLTPAPTAGLGVEAHHRTGQPVPTSATVAERKADSQLQQHSEQAAILPRIQLGHEQWRMGSGWEIQRHVLGRPRGYRALVARPVH